MDIPAKRPKEADNSLVKSEIAVNVAASVVVLIAVVFNVLGFPYVYFFIKESKDKDLEHMRELYVKDQACAG